MLRHSGDLHDCPARRSSVDEFMEQVDVLKKRNSNLYFWLDHARARALPRLKIEGFLNQGLLWV
jgi:hypothetical protein